MGLSGHQGLNLVEAMTPEEQGDAELLERMKGEHPGEDLLSLRSGSAVAIFRSPPYAEWKRFRSLFLDPAKRSDALETLVYGCLVFPTAPELRVMINRKPALAESWGGHLAAAAGMGAEVVEKK